MSNENYRYTAWWLKEAPASLFRDQMELAFRQGMSWAKAGEDE